MYKDPQYSLWRFSNAHKKNEKRDDLLTARAMGWGYGSLLRSGLLVRSQMVPKYKIKNDLWTDYSRLYIKHLLTWDLSPLPVHGVDSGCWHQFRDALHVAGTCFKRAFPQLWSPPSPCQPCEKWCTSQKQREVIFDLPRPLPPKVPDRTASKYSPCGCAGDSNRST